MIPVSPSNSDRPVQQHHRGTAVELNTPNPTEPTGPSKADRIRALEIAIDMVNHNNFTRPGKVALGCAEEFAQFIHNGEIK